MRGFPQRTKVLYLRWSGRTLPPPHRRVVPSIQVKWTDPYWVTSRKVNSITGEIGIDSGTAVRVGGVHVLVEVQGGSSSSKVLFGNKKEERVPVVEERSTRSPLLQSLLCGPS